MRSNKKKNYQDIQQMAERESTLLQIHEWDKTEMLLSKKNTIQCWKVYHAEIEWGKWRYILNHSLDNRFW